MAFFKFRARGQQANEGRNASVAAAPAESVEVLRRRARHRLLGAGVLVLIGVIGFPLLFDTQPRPIAVDIPIDIPDRNKAKPLTVPAAPAPAVAAAGADKPKPADTRVADARPSSGSGSSGGMITERADGTEIPSDRPLADASPRASAAPAPTPAPAPAPTPAPVARAPEVKPAVEPKPAPKPEPKPEPKPAAKPEVKVETPKPAAAPKPSSSDDGARARALLEGKPPSAAAAATTAAPAAAATSDDAGRFVIQVGAFADAEKAREVRQKLEKAGLKTYTNVAKTADGERTRVRVGPFSSRAEADRAAGRVKGLSLPASVLSL